MISGRLSPRMFDSGECVARAVEYEQAVEGRDDFLLAVAVQIHQSRRREPARLGPGLVALHVAHEHRLRHRGRATLAHARAGWVHARVREDRCNATRTDGAAPAVRASCTATRSRTRVVLSARGKHACHDRRRHHASPHADCPSHGDVPQCNPTSASQDDRWRSATAQHRTIARSGRKQHPGIGAGVHVRKVKLRTFRRCGVTAFALW
jgi:hypothetical protein